MNISMWGSPQNEVCTREQSKSKDTKKDFNDDIQVVYIAGAFRAETHYQVHLNVIHAEAVALRYWKKGYCVICPHTMTAHYQDECPDDVWLKGCEELVRRSDIIVMLKGWSESEGSKKELELATQLGREIRYE